jgi:hypothetical protein
VGAWGVGPFSNDYASDWAWEFENADLETGLRIIRDALNGAAAGYEGAENELAVAAAEMVAVINGKPAIGGYPDGFGEDAWDWLERTAPAKDDHLTELACEAVARVRIQGNLAGSWIDESRPRWRSYIRDLAMRLTGEPASQPDVARRPRRVADNPARNLIDRLRVEREIR